MKKLLNNYCYTLALAGMVAVISYLFTLNLHTDRLEGYMNITIDEGETIADIADQYDSGDLTKAQFIDWIEEQNHMHADTLSAGDNLVIPVKENALLSNLAGGE